MKTKSVLFGSVALALAMLMCTGASAQDRQTTATLDGPYVFYQPDGSTRLINTTVTKTYKGKKVVDKVVNVSDTTIKNLPKNFTLTVRDEDEWYSFNVPFHKVTRPQCHFPQPEKLFILSDPHGNFDCVVTLLKGNGIIDDNLAWAYGKNHVVVGGDIFDRGKGVLPIFWLFYKLEAEAEAAGGHFTFILGNHEQLVLMNDLRYSEDKYKELAEKLGVKYPELFGPDTELGRWLLTRNSMITIGRNLITHAGVSAEFYNRNLSLEQVNEGMSQGLFKRKAERKEAGDLIYFLHGSDGPIWYRGLVRTEPRYKPIASDSLDMILKRYDVDRIIVGHTIFHEPSPFLNQRVFGVNVSNKEAREKRRGRALLFTEGRIFVASDGGIIREIPQVK